MGSDLYWNNSSTGGGPGSSLEPDAGPRNAHEGSGAPLTRYKDKGELIARLDRTKASQGLADRDFLFALADADKAGVWIGEGFSSMAGWAAARYGISRFRAARYVAAGHRLARLPRIAEALATGRLSLDKTVELVRFATAGDEDVLLRWATRVVVSTIRERADAAVRKDERTDLSEETARYLCFTEGKDCLLLDARLPGDDAELFRAAIERVASELPLSQDTDDPEGARRADALIELVTSPGSGAGEPVVVVHAPAAALLDGSGTDGCITSDGIPVLTETARRFMCEGITEVVRYDERGTKIAGHGRKQRFATPEQRRAVLDRQDHRCFFFGCERRTKLVIHHSDEWHKDHGPTDTDLLVGVCPVHHRYLHHLGWKICLVEDELVLFRPDGTRYRGGPAPPERPPPEPSRAHPEDLERIFKQAFCPSRMTPALTLRLLRGEFTGVMKDLATAS